MPEKGKGNMMSEHETGTVTALEAEVEKWKALSRKNEERAKDNAEKAQRVDELERQHQELVKQSQDAANRADAAEKALSDRAAADERSKLIAEVAKERNITDPSVLVGESREELEQFADKIAALIPEKPKAPSADVQGNRGSDIAPVDESPTPNDLIRAAARN